MRVKEILARSSGGVAGTALALGVPHIGCAAAILAPVIGVGASAELATNAGYAVTGFAVAAAGMAGWYGFRPSQEACCIAFGETRRAMVKKGAALAAACFAAVAVVNTVTDQGPSLEQRAEIIEAWRNNGMSVWDAERELSLICGSTARWSWLKP